MGSVWLSCALLLACGNDSDTGEQREEGEREGSQRAQPPTAESLGESVEVAEGYTRYYSSIQEVPSGGSLNLVEWVAPAFAQDMDVVAVKGGQTLGGHHVTLTASSALEEEGTVREYDNEDQLTSRIVGGAGDIGEDSVLFELPENHVFRIFEGQGLFLQAHYINLTDAPLEVRSYIDVALVEASDEHTVLKLFTNATVNNDIPPGSEYSLTSECVTGDEIELVMFANHQHEFGVSIRTEATFPDGSTMVLKDDPVWNEEWQLDVNFAYHFDDPVVIPAGTTLSTHCEWNNTTDSVLSFPDEMCIFLGYGIQDLDVTCRDGMWIRRSPGGGSSVETPVTAIGDGECSSEEQLAAVTAVRDSCMGLPRMDIVGCGLPLLEGDSACIVECFEEGGASSACGQCHGDFLVCNAEQCAASCQGNADGDECAECQATECCPAFEACSGLSC